MSVQEPAGQREDAIAVLTRCLDITRRQAEVGYCIVEQGLTDEEAARALGIAARTVKGHLRVLRKELNTSRIGLVKHVCRVLHGALSRDVVGEDGRLRLKVVEQRLGISPQLAVVVRLMWEEKSSKEIARRLSITLNTAESYRRRIRRELQGRSTVRVVRKVYRALSGQSGRRGSSHEHPGRFSTEPVPPHSG